MRIKFKFRLAWPSFCCLVLLMAGIHSPARAQNPPSDSVRTESEELLRRINNAPSQRQNRAIGPFSVPVSGAGNKLIPDISVIGSFVAGYFSDEPVGATGHDPARTGFTLQEIELAFQAPINPYFQGDVFFAFHEDHIDIEEAYFTTQGLVKGLQIRGGKFWVPFGRQNVKHVEQWHFADNMLVNKYFLGAEGLSELGAEVAYVVPLPIYLQAQLSVTNGDNAASFGGNRKQDLLYQGRLSASADLSPVTTLLWGASAAFGFNDSGLGNKTNLFGGDFLFRWRPNARRSLSWQNEFILRRAQLPGILRQDGGFYSFVDYQFLQRWHAGFRFDYVGLPESAFVKEWRLTPVLTLKPTEFSRVRLQYEYDKARNRDGYHAAFLQVQFSMGPHGAHTF